MPPAAGRWSVLTLLFAVCVVTYLDRVNISVAGRPMSLAYGLTDVEFGSIFSAFVVGYAIFQVPGGWLGDRVGHATTIAVALASWSAFTLLTPWAGNGALAAAVGIVPALWIVRFLIGAGEAAAYPCATALIARWFPPEERAFATGIFFAGIGAGSTLTPPLVGWLMVTFSWEVSFYVCGVIGLLLCIVFARRVSDSPAAMAVPPGADVAAAPGDREPARQRTPWRRLAGDRRVLLLTSSYACFGYAGYVYFAWFYRYLVDGRAFDPMAGSLVATVPFLAMAIGSAAGGWLSDRWTARLGAIAARRRVAMSGLLPGLPLLAAGSSSSIDALAVACLSIGFGLMSLSLSSYWSTITQVLPSSAGTAAAIMNTGLNAAGAAAPILTPIIKDTYGWPAAWWTAGAASLAAGLLWTIVGAREPEPDVAEAVPARPGTA
jgi:ACS family glucarate transporter-like MFS transporter